MQIVTDLIMDVATKNSRYVRVVESTRASQCQTFQPDVGRANKSCNAMTISAPHFAFFSFFDSGCYAASQRRRKLFNPSNMVKIQSGWMSFVTTIAAATRHLYVVKSLSKNLVSFPLIFRMCGIISFFRLSIDARIGLSSFSGFFSFFFNISPISFTSKASGLFKSAKSPFILIFSTFLSGHIERMLYEKLLYVKSILFNRRDCAEELLKSLWGDALWTPSFFASSCGGAPLEILKLYVQDQQTKPSRPKGTGFQPKKNR